MEEMDPKKVELYLKQKALLEQFLRTGAISQAQFDKSFGCLTGKMGMEAYSGPASGNPEGSKTCGEGPEGAESCGRGPEEGRKGGKE